MRENATASHSIWLVRVPSKPISHSNGYHMHILSYLILSYLGVFIRLEAVSAD